MNPSPLDPHSPTFKADVEARLHTFAEEYSCETYPASHRNHLGASSIGEECYRKLWYSFRWVKLQQAEGRMRRLWNRGHREEKVFEEFLIWAGIRVQSINPKTDKQYVFSKVSGHYGGSTDGIGIVTWANKLPIIVEFKTFADKYFQTLKKEKVKKSNPKYYAQMSSYGREFEVKQALFCAVNKDNDEFYFELVELDWQYAEELEKKATDIIHSKNAPDRMPGANPAFYKCKWCEFNGICFEQEPVEKNCRSCKFSEPGPNATWVCQKFGVIPKDFIPNGCPQFEGIV